MISWSHLRFRAHKDRAALRTTFPSPAHPISNYVCLAFVAGMLVIMYLTPDLRLSVYLIPAWLVVLAAGYWFSVRAAAGAALKVGTSK